MAERPKPLGACAALLLAAVPAAVRAGPPSERPAPDAGAPAPSDAAAPLPSLSPAALCEELGRSARERAAELKKIQDARDALARDKAELDGLAKSIEQARAALRAEAERLERFLGLATEATRPGGDRYWQVRIAELEKAGASSSLDALAKTVKGMKAEQAAVLVATLDPALAAAVLARLRPADRSAVLEKMKPSQAAELFGRMAEPQPAAKEARKP